MSDSTQILVDKIQNHFIEEYGHAFNQYSTAYRIEIGDGVVKIKSFSAGEFYRSTGELPKASVEQPTPQRP